MTPPNVPLTPYPASSIIINNMLGAPFSGTTRGGHHVCDSATVFPILLLSTGCGAGISLPLMVVVASAAPGVPVVCTCACTTKPLKSSVGSSNTLEKIYKLFFIIWYLLDFCVFRSELFSLYDTRRLPGAFAGRQDRHSSSAGPIQAHRDVGCVVGCVCCYELPRFTVANGGCFQLPSSAAGPGQYRRMYMAKAPFGAGSQFDSLSLPGDSFWM